MAYVITEPCIGTCDQSCVKVCPVECIKTDFRYNGRGMNEIDLGKMSDKERKDVAAHMKLQLYIDPDTCIDCGACEPECPVDAIFEASNVPDKWHKYTEINAAYFRR
jgi:ferredoxin